MRMEDKQEKALMMIQEYIENQLNNPHNLHVYVCIVYEEDGYPTFEINTDMWSMDFNPHNKSLCFNGDGIDSRGFDQIKEIRDNGDTILSIYNRVMMI